MPYGYTAAPVSSLATSGSADTEDRYLSMREATTGCRLVGFYVQGMSAAATTLTGIVHRMRRWTTASTGGGTVTIGDAEEDQPAAGTAVVDKSTAISGGSGGGTNLIAIGHGATGPGGWVARDDAQKKNLTPGSADSFDFYSSQGGTSALNFEPSVEFEER